MTKEEKIMMEKQTKELKMMNSKLDRLIRLLSIQTTMGIRAGSTGATAFEIEADAILNSNDIFEETLKNHALEVSKRKKEEFANEKQDG